MSEFPMPNDQLAGMTVVASGWIDDVRAGVLALTQMPGRFYAIFELDLIAGTFDAVETFNNIIPAARKFEERYDFWGGP